MSFGSNIKAARMQRNLTQNQVAQALGISRNAVSQWESDTTSPGLLRMSALAHQLSYSVEQITSPGFSPANSLASSNYVTIQQCDDVAGAMGSGIILKDQPGSITSWDVTPEWAHSNIPKNTGIKNLRIVTGFGDSMRGMFNSGDPLIVDTGVTSVEYDAVYFFRVGSEGFIKRLQRVPGRGLVAISENRAYETWEITDEMEFEVFARVLKVWKSEEF